MHPCFSILLHGTITETYSKRTLDWKPFSFGFNLADEDHTTQVHSTGARFLIIEVGREWLARARDCAVIFDDSMVVEGGMLTCLSARLYHEVQNPDELSSLAIEGIMLEMIAEISRANRIAEYHCPRWLEQARELIHAKYSEPLSLSSVAETVGVHPVHLARMFRRTYQCTVGDYIHNLRIQFACHELATSDAPFSQIAVAAGFYDQGHLSRIFKRRTGMTPSRYRSISRRR